MRKRELEGGESGGGTAAANALGPRQQWPGEGETETGPRQQRPGVGETETRRTHSDKGTAPDGAPARRTGALAAVALCTSSGWRAIRARVCAVVPGI